MTADIGIVVVVIVADEPCILCAVGCRDEFGANAWPHDARDAAATAMQQLDNLILA